MTLSRDSVLALKRHFVGGLRVPSPLWLEPSPAPGVRLVSDSLCAGVVDFGTVESPRVEQRVVSVTNQTERAVTVVVAEAPSWLQARWRTNNDRSVRLTNNAAELELVAEHDVSSETRLTGKVRLQLDDDSGASRNVDIGVRMLARCTQAQGIYDFHGSPEPRAYDFAGGALKLSFENATRVPLDVTVADLPPWLAMTVDGQTREGPAPGVFFKRAAPFRATLWPRPVPGSHSGSIRIETNDGRQRYQSMRLPLSATFRPSPPFVRVRRSDQPGNAVILENYGRSPARLETGTSHPAFDLRDLPVVPAAEGDSPGTATLPIRIRADHLAAGTHTLFFTLRVLEGDPSEITVPVQVNVAPAPPARSSSANAVELVIGAAAVLLLIAWTFVAIVKPGL